MRTSPTYDGATGPRDRYVGIRWLLPDKQWVQVTSWGPRTEDDILRYGRGVCAGLETELGEGMTTTVSGRHPANPVAEA